MDRRTFLSTASSAVACATLPISLFSTEAAAIEAAVPIGGFDPILDFIKSQLAKRGMVASRQAIVDLTTEVKEVITDKQENLIADFRALEKEGEFFSKDELAERCMQVHDYVLEKLGQYLDVCKEKGEPIVGSETPHCEVMK
jgi:hypothetical protein